MKPQGEILVNIFTFVFFEFLYFNMSKGYNNTIYTITIIMLITAINFISYYSVKNIDIAFKFN